MEIGTDIKDFSISKGQLIWNTEVHKSCKHDEGIYPEEVCHRIGCLTVSGWFTFLLIFAAVGGNCFLIWSTFQFIKTIRISEAAKVSFFCLTSLENCSSFGLGLLELHDSVHTDFTRVYLLEGVGLGQLFVCGWSCHCVFSKKSFQEVFGEVQSL